MIVSSALRTKALPQSGRAVYGTNGAVELDGVDHAAGKVLVFGSSASRMRAVGRAVCRTSLDITGRDGRIGLVQGCLAVC